MDNTQSIDLSSVISALSQNPAALSAIGSIMENINKKPPPPPEPKGLDIGALLSLLGAKNEQKEPPPEKHEQNPFGSKEDIKNRIALLNAVKPFLSEKRQEKLELIIKLLKLSELGELTKLLGKLG